LHLKIATSLILFAGSLQSIQVPSRVPILTWVLLILSVVSISAVFVLGGAIVFVSADLVFLRGFDAVRPVLHSFRNCYGVLL